MTETATPTKLSALERKKVEVKDTRIVHDYRETKEPKGRARVTTRVASPKDRSKPSVVTIYAGRFKAAGPMEHDFGKPTPSAKDVRTLTLEHLSA